MLTFDEATHTYYWNEQKVPNVTTVIDSLTDYSRINKEVLERAKQLGKGIHSMIELHFKNDLDVENLPEWIKPYHTALLAFIDDTGLF